MTGTEHAVCLGCGCACDDIGVAPAPDGSVRVTRACRLGEAWWARAATAPAGIRADGASAALDAALRRAAAVLAPAAGRTLLWLGPDLSTEAVRWAIALADRLRATIDTPTSPSAADGILAAQRRGRAGATLGEARQRGDVVVWWGCDPAARYPRFAERYAPLAPGSLVPRGRADRTVIGVSVGADRAPADADLALDVPPDLETDVLGLARALVDGHPAPDGPAAALARPLVERLLGARYAVVLHDAEPQGAARHPARAEALITLVQSLNTPTRAALISLRQGGNVNGIESALTWQTGFPLAVTFDDGAPGYAPDRRGVARLAAGAFDAVLVAGDAGALPAPLREALAGRTVVAVGPFAGTIVEATVAIDTGVAGVHEGGTAYRLDDVPLPLTPVLAAPVGAAGALASLLCHLDAEPPA